MIFINIIVKLGLYKKKKIQYLVFKSIKFATNSIDKFYLLFKRERHVTQEDKNIIVN